LCRYFPVIFDEATTEAILGQAIEKMPVGYRGLTFGAGDI